MTRLPSFEIAFMAIEKVHERLMRSTRALDRHGVPYAVIGGNAVAAWVATVDEDAVRSTKDVDLLVNRTDLPRVDAALGEVGFEQAEVQGITLFVERENPSPKKGVHLLFAGEPVRTFDAHCVPTLERTWRSREGYAVIDLVSLLKMKLVAYRLRDLVHIEDMLELNLITPEIEAQLPPDLLQKLNEIRAKPE